jgi:tetratricopeptide (TPR) repeat protein
MIQSTTIYLHLLLNLGNLYLKQKDYVSAVNCFKKANKINKAISINNTSSAKIYNSLGRAYQGKKEVQRAISCFILCIKMNERNFAWRKRLLNNMLELIGVDLTVAIRCRKNFIKLSGYNSEYTARSCFNLGVIYYNLNLYLNSYIYFQEAKNLFKFLHLDESIINNYLVDLDRHLFLQEFHHERISSNNTNNI